MTYYLSLWIANLGVEPLFSIIFFLALPAFFLLNLLLHFVCIVFEAIILPLPFFNHLLCKLRPLFLSILSLNVKVFLIFPLSVTLCNKAYASNIKEIFISPGEQVELTVLQLRKYSVGNKEVIRHKYRPKTGKILIKGKRIGFSDLVIWKARKKEVYHLYVISKKDQLKQITLIESLKKMNLLLRTQGDIVYAEGLIQKEEDYLLIKKIQEKKHKNLILNIKLDKSLRNIIYSKIYSSLYQDGAQHIFCQNFGIEIQCFLQGLPLSATSIEYFSKKYFISFNHESIHMSDKNYIAHFKIIQVETSSQESFKLGPSQISAKVHELMHSKEIINNELIHIGNSLANFKVLAEPKTSLVLNKKANIQLGGELPFSIQQNQMTSVKWKFYGLKIHTMLKSENGKPLIQYETELTAPQSQAIAGSKGKSSLYITQGKFTKLFEIGYKTDSDQKDYLPLLGKIPLLRHLFTSDSQGRSYKHIVCFLKLEEV